MLAGPFKQTVAGGGEGRGQQAALSHYKRQYYQSSGCIYNTSLT